MRTSVIVLAGLLVAGAGSEARAQMGRPLDGRLIVSISGAAQPGSQDLSRTSTFTLYDEQAEIIAAQEVKGGGLFEIGASYRVSGPYGVGIAFSRLSSTGAGTTSGSLPHPLFFDAPRQFGVPASGLRHKERAVHLQAIYTMPFVENVDLAFSAGPSFFNVSQGFARDLTFVENPPSYNTITVEGIENVSLSESAVGFNIGAEGTYSFTENVGAGILMRYTRASADFKVADGPDVSVKAGGFQLGGGLRLRF